MKKLILVVAILTSSIANDYIDFSTGSSSSDSSIFGNYNSDMYGFTYMYKWSTMLDRFPNTNGLKLSKSYMRGENFRFTHAGYFGWSGAFSGSSIKELEYHFDSAYVFAIHRFFNPYFGVNLGLGARINDPFLLSKSDDWLISFWQNFFVTQLEVGSTSSITKTLDIKLSYTKSYTFQLAHSANIGLIFKCF